MLFFHYSDNLIYQFHIQLISIDLQELKQHQDHSFSLLINGFSSDSTVIKKNVLYQRIRQSDDVGDDEPLNTIANKSHGRRREKNGGEREIT